MKKSGIIALIAGGAALVGAGIIKAISKPKEVDLIDEEAEYEEIECDYETEESED